MKISESSKGLLNKDISILYKCLVEMEGVLTTSTGKSYPTSNVNDIYNGLRRTLHDFRLELYRLTIFERYDEVINLKVNDNWGPNFPNDEIIAILQPPIKMSDGTFYGSWRVYFCGADDGELAITFENEQTARNLWNMLNSRCQYIAVNRSMLEKWGEICGGERE